MICNAWSQIKHVRGTHCHSLQVVDRGSETQLQVGENVFFSVAL